MIEEKDLTKQVLCEKIEKILNDDLGIEYDKNYFRPDSFEKYGIKEKDGKIFLSRKQLLRWYELYLESKKLSTNQNYEVPSNRIINKFVIQYELQLEKNNTYVIPEPMLSIFGIESIDGLVKSRRKPKGYIKDFVETNFSTIFFGSQITIANCCKS